MSINKSLKRRARAVRAKVKSTHASGQRRYPKELRAEIMDCTSLLREAGESWTGCAEALGVHKMTIYGWSRRSAKRSSVALVPVKVKSDPQPVIVERLKLRTPNGLELTGISLEQARELLRALG